MSQPQRVFVVSDEESDEDFDESAVNSEAIAKYSKFILVQNHKSCQVNLPERLFNFSNLPVFPTRSTASEAPKSYRRRGQRWVRSFEYHDSSDSSPERVQQVPLNSSGSSTPDVIPLVGERPDEPVVVDVDSTPTVPPAPVAEDPTKMFVPTPSKVNCSICFNTELQDVYHVLSSCFHVFHKDCINSYM